MFHAHASAHNKRESVGPTFSSLESNMASLKVGELRAWSEIQYFRTIKKQQDDKTRRN